jgi:putative LysE/RhtB family amino acid efflux pump
VALGLLGAGVLVLLGLRTLGSAFRVRLGGETGAEVATRGRAFRTALAGTASNPSTIASWAAIFAAASAAGAAGSTVGAVLLVAGVAVGSLVWVSTLATGVALARRAIGDRAMRIADLVAGLAMLGFGGALGYAATHER